MLNYLNHAHVLAFFLGAAACNSPADQKADAKNTSGSYPSPVSAADGIGVDSEESSSDVSAPSGAPSAEGAASSGAGDSIGASSPSSEAPTAPASRSTEIQSGTLTAAAFSDALNLTTFMNYLQSHANIRIKLPEASPFTYDMDQEKLKVLVPAKEATASTKLDLGLMIDITGSMGDELLYLQKEWTTLTNDLQIVFPNLAVRMSLVVYRDTSDSFVTAGIPFTDKREAYQAELSKYKAEGGGDHPEAVDAALGASNKLEWDASSRKVLFWVADASPHEDKEAASVTEILKLRDKGVHIYPLAASGVDDRAELIMRIGALLTGGQYLFLTNDSGIGNSHAEPHIPCYNVERLNQLMLRILTEEVSGLSVNAKPENILRSVGKSTNGVCQVSPAPDPQIVE